MSRRIVAAALAVPLALSLILVGMAGTISASTPPPYFPMVHQVICDNAKGTAVRVKDAYLSVHHVTSRPGCNIDGKPIEIEHSSGKLDFSILKRRGHGMKIDCGGFKLGQYVFAVGYAYGWPLQRTVMLRVINLPFSDHVVLVGKETVIPGMSGGPVMNAQGEIVGMVNAYHPSFGLSFSRALKDTSVCK